MMKTDIIPDVTILEIVSPLGSFLADCTFIQLDKNSWKDPLYNCKYTEGGNNFQQHQHVGVPDIKLSNFKLTFCHQKQITWLCTATPDMTSHVSL